MILYRKYCQWYGRELWQREHHESLKGLYHWRCHLVIEKAVKAIKHEIANSCWRNCVQVLYIILHDLQQSQSRKSWKILRTGQVVKWVFCFKVCSRTSKIQELLNTPTKEWTESLTEMSGSQSVSDDQEEDAEEAAPETSDIRQSGKRTPII